MTLTTVEMYSLLGDNAYASGTDPDKIRRLFNFGERIAELEPAQSPFFSYLNKVRKEFTDDGVFKFLEQRHQWQRRDFQTTAAFTSGAYSSAWNDWSDDDVTVDCAYDKYGRKVAGSTPTFFVLNQIVAIEAWYAADASNYIVPCIANYRIDTVDSQSQLHLTCIGVYRTDTTAAATFTPAASSTLRLKDNAKGQIVGSAFAEGTGAPLGWRDELYDREGYCQIFKTAIPLFSNTTRATRYRGVANEYLRVWKEKLKEHKMDMEHASLFGIGSNAEASSTSGFKYTWGILPYTELYGNVYNFEYDSSGYDQFLDAMEDFFAPESGNSGDKLVLASRKVLTYLNKIGQGGFLNNTVGSDQYRLDVQNIKGQFGHMVTKVNTFFGNLHFIAEPLLRGPFENYAIAVDLKNVAWRPLRANGINRDTHIITNVQDNDIDGRKDQILTEAGLRIDLPETHAILRWA